MCDNAEACQRRANDLDSQGLANTVWAFATAGVNALGLFEAVTAAALPRLGEFNSQNLANMVWTFATAVVNAPELFDAVADAALPRLGEFNSDELATTLWAFASAGRISADQIVAILDMAVANMSTFDERSLSQLHQFWLCARFERRRSISLGPQHEERLRRAFLSGTPRPSRLQHDVSDVPLQMGWAREFEYVTEEGLSLDMAQPGSKRGIEVDGPHHYLREVRSWDFAEDGATRLKSRLLEGLGWTLARIPFYEWDRLESDAAKRRYLAEKLDVKRDRH